MDIDLLENSIEFRTSIPVFYLCLTEFYICRCIHIYPNAFFYSYPYKEMSKYHSLFNFIDCLY